MTSDTTHTTASDQQVSLGTQLQQLQPQHLANLLLQAASRLSATLPSSSNTAAQPASTQVQAATHNAPITMASQQAMVLCNAAVQSSQQDNQLSEASAFVSPIQPLEPIINPSASTVSNPEPISSLPPVSARLRDRIIAVQMSAQSGGFQVTQAPTTTRKINSCIMDESLECLCFYITFSQTITCT